MRKLALAILFLAVLTGCGPSKCDEAVFVEQTKPKLQEFQDAMELAASTPRMSLAGPIADLQEIRRDTQNIEIDPSCSELLKAQDYLVRGMDEGVQAFIAFIGQESDRVIESHFTAAANQFRLYNDMIEKWLEEG